jgi:hypothetical protein
MRTELDVSIAPAPAPGNIFTPEYLALLSPCDDEPVTAAEAAISVPTSDPWHLEPHSMEPGWAVLRQGESRFTTQPHASFQNIDVARLAAAVIPSTEQPPRYRLGQEQDALGYPVFAGDQVVGHFQFFDESLLAAMNVVAAVVSVPGDLAWLLHAAGGQALDHAGKIALERTLPPF